MLYVKLVPWILNIVYREGINSKRLLTTDILQPLFELVRM